MKISNISLKQLEPMFWTAVFLCAKGICNKMLCIYEKLKSFLRVCRCSSPMYIREKSGKRNSTHTRGFTYNAIAVLVFYSFSQSSSFQFKPNQHSLVSLLLLNFKILQENLYWISKRVRNQLRQTLETKYSQQK